MNLPFSRKKVLTVFRSDDADPAWIEATLGASSSNGFAEAINGLIQAAKRRARGYRTTKNLINMAYRLPASLILRYPLETAKDRNHTLKYRHNCYG
jgi:hypothetical protein